MLRWMRRGIGLGALLLGFTATANAQGFSPPDLFLTQDTGRDTSQVTATWFYTPPQNWTISYEHWLSAADVDVWRDSTGVQSITFGVARESTDIQRTFCVRVLRLEPSPKEGPSTCQTFTIPARVPYVALINESNIVAPTIIPHTADMANAEGTVWIEFTPNASAVAYEGLFSMDHTGYGTGGHFSIGVLGGQVEARIQDLTQSYTIIGGTAVTGDLNQVAVVYGPTGLQLYVNGVGIGTDPYTGGTQGNVEAVRLGASAQSAQPGSQTFTGPFNGTINQVEWYDGLYDFSGRWTDEPPLPPPPPVDSLVIEIASLSYGWTNDGNEYYWSAKFAPILEAEMVTVFVDDVAVRSKPLWLAPIGFPVVFNSSMSNINTGITEYRGHLPPGCNTDGQYGYGGNTTCSHECVVTYGPNDEWTMNNNECGFTRQQKISYHRRATCADPIYNTDFHEECYFDQNMSQGIHVNLPIPGSNPMIRIEVYDAQGHRLGYWERRSRTT